MLLILSPAKKLDFSTQNIVTHYTQPALTDNSSILIEELRKCSIEDLIKLMNISYGIAETNIQRYLQWSVPFVPNKAKQAILAFNGDVYEGLQAKKFTSEDFHQAQQKIRILSGLYGVLRPLDLIMPYRLPMGSKLVNERGKNLYEFWGDIITNELNKTLAEQNTDILINLASNEYFKAINPSELKAKIVEVNFKEEKNGTYRVVSFLAKKARGMMANYIIKNKISDIEDLKGFDFDKYHFDQKQSDKNKMVFVR